MPICAFGVGRCVACGMRSWRMWWRRESRNWRLPASTARSRAHIRRRPGRGRANPSAGSAIYSHRRVSGGGAGAVERWAWHQDRRRVRCRRAAGRFPGDAGPGARIGPLADAVAAPARGAGLGIGRHGMRRAGVPFGGAGNGRDPGEAVAQGGQAAAAMPRLHLSPSQFDRTLLVAPQRATSHRRSLRQDRSFRRSRHRHRRYPRLDQVSPLISHQMRTGPSVPFEKFPAILSGS